MQVSKFLARFFTVLVVGVLLLKPSIALAQSTTPPPETAEVGGQNITPQDIAAAIKSPTPNLANTTAYVFYTITVLLSGTFDSTLIAGQTVASADAPSQLATTYPTSVNDAVQNGGLLSGVAYLTAGMVKNPPASAELYVADLVQNSRFAPQQAYAQAPGLGFGALNPILGTWRAFRNVAYYLLILAGIVVGMLVLVRHKVSGNVAVTVQAALPRIVITLVLITFSYAIAGLMVDLLYLSIYFIINLFNGRVFETGAQFLGGKSLSDIAFNTHIFEFTLKYVFNGHAWNAATAIGAVLYGAITSLGDSLGFLNDSANPLTNVLQWIVNQLFALIIAIAIFIAMFRTFFSLLMSYAGFVINVVMSPLILLPGVIPGNNPFGNWMKNLVAGLAPFAVAIFMIFMSFALIGEETVGDIGYKNVTDDNTGLRLPLIMSGVDSGAFTGILALGFILLLPEAVNMTKKAVGASGGIFDEFKDKAVANFQKGWEGNKRVPGAKKLAPWMVGSGVGVPVVGGAALGAAGGALVGNRFGARGKRAGQIIGGAAGATLGLASVPFGGGAVGAGIGLTAKGVQSGAQMTQKVWKEKIEPLDKFTASAQRFGTLNAARGQQATVPQAVESRPQQATGSLPQPPLNASQPTSPPPMGTGTGGGRPRK